MSALPTGTVTFLFTDIEGSTRLLQRLGDDYAEVLAAHQALLRAAFAAHGGTEVDTQGDSFFVAFPTAAEAVAAAADATRALADQAWPGGAAVRVRMGLHTGTPQLVGDHYVGLDVVRAARIAAAGHGGQVLLSQTTRDLVEAQLPEGARLRDLGAQRLKDLQRPEHLFQLVLADLPAEFPPLKSLDRHANNLPIQPTVLLGRNEEVAAVCVLLRRDEVRLVTLTGAGGVGKTRLALQVAAELVDTFADGVWFAGLSRLADPALVLPTIAQTLGLQEAGSRPIQDLLRDFVHTRQLLLLLDNCEQVAQAAPALADLLASSPGLTVLVTSRVALHLQSEHEYPVPPLPVPASPSPGRTLQIDHVLDSPAVALFVERAQAHWPDFRLTQATAPAVAAICARLDGLPLAIALAAARVKVLPPAQLLQRLERRLPMLTGGARDLEERQQTMQRAIAWSDDLLSPEEQRLFRRLAVFVGGATLEAAEAVCTAPAGAEPLGRDLLDGLGTLVDQSLVQQHEEDGEPRFGTLHVIREYALVRLEASGEANALRRAHAAYFVALAEEVELWLVGGPRLPEGLARLEREHDNLRAALAWTRRQGEVALGLRLAGAMARFWFLRGHLREGREWLDGVLALAAAGQIARGEGQATSADDAGPERARAKALYGAGELATLEGDYRRGEPLLERSLVLARAAGDEALTVRVLNRLGYGAMNQGDFERATTWCAESLALARQLGDPLHIVMPLNNLGSVAYLQGDLQRAEAHYTAVVAMDRQAGDLLWLANDLTSLASTRRRRGDLPQTFQLLRKAFAVLREAVERGWPMISFVPMPLVALAAALAVAGHSEQAARFLGAGEALGKTFGVVWGAVVWADTEVAVAPARAALGEEAWAAAYAAGQAMTLEEAIAEALEEAIAEALEEAIAEALEEAIAEALEEAIAEALEETTGR